MLQMKNSGVEWIGNIPENWNVERLQWHLYEINDKNNPIKSTEVLSLTNKRGVIPYEEKGAQGNISKENYAEYHLAYKDTIVANSMNILIGSVGYSNYFGCVSPVYYVFKEKKGTSLRFINYIMQTTQFQKELRKFANGILEIRMRVSVDDIFKRKIAIPTLQEQENIANFLDKKCGEIDGLISDIEKEIEILTQYKKSIITETVTKGLDKNTKLKSTDIKWADKIPEHWNVKKGKYCLKYIVRPIKDSDDIITCFRDGEVTLRKNRREEGFTMADKEIGYQGINKGDLVVHGMDGFAGAIGISDSRGKASPVLNVLDTTENKKYIMYYLRSLAFNEVFTAMSTGIRVRSCDLRWNKLAELLYILPPIAEQNQIVDYLDKKINEINSVLEDKNKQLETLESYKKSIIYEYVTGKKEVI